MYKSSVGDFCWPQAFLMYTHIFIATILITTTNILKSMILQLLLSRQQTETRMCAERDKKQNNKIRPCSMF